MLKVRERCTGSESDADLPLRQGDGACPDTVSRGNLHHQQVLCYAPLGGSSAGASNVKPFSDLRTFEGAGRGALNCSQVVREPM